MSFELENFEQPLAIGEKTGRKTEVEKREKKEIMPEVFQEIKEDIESGRCIYNIMTKIMKGTFFRGYEEKNNVPPYRHYTVGSEVALEKMGARIKEGSDIDFLSSKEEYGNAAVLIAPLRILEVFTRKEKEKKRKFFRTKEVEIEKEVRRERNAVLKDLGAEGKERLYRLKLLYSSSAEGTGRRAVTVVTFCLRKSLAERFLDEIEKYPENFWKFIDFIEPNLSKVTSPKGGIPYSKGIGLTILKEGRNKEDRECYGGPKVKPVKFLSWRQKFSLQQKF